jgi:hypothetical protein
LPQPVGPTIAQNWPGSTVNVVSLRAVNAEPAGVRNRLVSPVTSMRALPRGALEDRVDGDDIEVS